LLFMVNVTLLHLVITILHFYLSFIMTMIIVRPIKLFCIIFAAFLTTFEPSTIFEANGAAESLKPREFKQFN
jgi:hypothetical protein